MLPPPAISVIATTSEEHENHNDYQNGCHSFLQNIHREASLLYMVRNNYVTSLGIYLVLPVASGWFVAIAVVLTNFGIPSGSPASLLDAPLPRQATERELGDTRTSGNGREQRDRIGHRRSPSNRPSSAVVSDLISRSRWRGWCPQPGDLHRQEPTPSVGRVAAAVGIRAAGRL